MTRVERIERPLAAERAEIVARAKILSAAFAESAGHHDRTGKFPFANFDALSAAGILALTIDPKFGGYGAGLVDALAVVNTIARGEPSTALVLSMHYIQHSGLARNFGLPPHLHERLSRESVAGISLINGIQVEPALGSPSRGGLPETTARRAGDEWRISGHKLYATGAPILGWLNVLARTDEAEPRVANFLVPAKTTGLRIVETWDQIGMRATASHDLIFDNVAVPLDHALNLRPASQLAIADDVGRGWYFGMLAAVYDGIARAARDWLIEFLKSRAPASLGAPLSTVPRIQEAVGAIEALLAVNTSMLRAIGEDTDNGKPLSFAEAGLVKHVVTSNAIEVTTLALSLCGNHGLARTNPLERHHRNALCGRIHAPQDDTIRIAAGRAALA